MCVTHDCVCHGLRVCMCEGFRRQADKVLNPLYNGFRRQADKVLNPLYNGFRRQADKVLNPLYNGFRRQADKVDAKKKKLKNTYFQKCFVAKGLI